VKRFGIAMAALLALGLAAQGVRAALDSDHRMVVLGIDGLDPNLLEQYMGEGILPNFAKLGREGTFMPLGTSIPPQSPVAWSNFITGMDPGGHGIFDFIALDRKTLLPYMSTSRVEPPSLEPLEIGKWRIPLGSGETLQLRDGVAFFQILEDNGIPTTMFRVPANYPPVETGGHSLSGMGTPDMRGTPGTFSFYTNDPGVEPKRVSGGVIKRSIVRAQRVTARIGGPPNGFLDGDPTSTAEFQVLIDPEHAVAEITTSRGRALLNVGEWSGWLPLDFDLVPLDFDLAPRLNLGEWSEDFEVPQLVSVPGMVRFYLKSIEPYFRLYASPVNIDPAAPAQPISTPEEYSAELSAAVGRFYTQEMPEDTKALSAHLITASEFLEQSGLVLEERRKLLRHELARFAEEQRRGLLFFYFSSADQREHMLWRQMDEEHPFHDPDGPANLAEALRSTYVEFDEILGWTMAALDDDTTLLVMSDHGFSPFRRQANLNTWLEQNGYLVLKNPERRASYEWLRGIDWARTKAFAIGLNSLYLNVRGRERSGSVPARERAALAREIADKLHGWIDPENGAQVVTQAVLREEVYHGPHVDEAPDIIVGYGRGYRSSWGTTSGKIPAGLLEDNDREWSGDHCMDARVVPGVLLSNRKLSAKSANLLDLPVSILAEFEIPAPEQMKGESVF
jgi:predicted AlkP superfamily phosphohydrolase/phosphomutase